MDMITAVSYEEVDEDVYMEVSGGVVRVEMQSITFKLGKALYGLKHAPRRRKF